MSAPLIADRIAHRLRWEDIDPEAVSLLVHMAREEDVNAWGLIKKPRQRGDVTSQVLQQSNRESAARLVAREDLVICGLPLIPEILGAYANGLTFEPASTDGEHCTSGEVIGIIRGPSRHILEAERVLLNFLQKLSGVASLTQSYVSALEGSPTRLLDTRKTTPGYRVLEKYAVACGGGFNHRIGLFDRVMLKDNHLEAAGSTSGEALAGLVRSARERWPELVIELEVDHLRQIEPVLNTGVDVFLLDNFSLSDIKKAVALIGDKAATEASGGITIDTLPQLSKAGLDFISSGATIHQSVWKDIALDWNEDPS
jgi:nicotinate-nucleotide pyrophosphorylase (carboxylating)